STTAAYRRQQIGVRLSGCFSPLLGASTTAASSPHSSPQKSPQFQSPSRGFNDCSQSKSLIVSWGRLRFSPLLGASTTAAYRRQQIGVRLSGCFSPLLGASTTAASSPHSSPQKSPQFQSPSRGFNDCSQSKSLIVSWGRLRFSPLLGASTTAAEQEWGINPKRLELFQSPSRGFNDCSLPQAADRRPPFWLFQSPSRGFNDCSLIATLIATEITTVSVPFSGLQR